MLVAEWGWLREGSLAGRDAGETRARMSDLPGLGRAGSSSHATPVAAGCQLALGCGVGVVDPRAKRRFWD